MKSHKGKDFGEGTDTASFSRLLTAGRYSKTREKKTTKSFGNWKEQLFKQRKRSESRHATLARPLDSDSRSSKPPGSLALQGDFTPGYFIPFFKKGKA